MASRPRPPIPYLHPPPDRCHGFLTILELNPAIPEFDDVRPESRLEIGAAIVWDQQSATVEGQQLVAIHKPHRAATIPSLYGRRHPEYLLDHCHEIVDRWPNRAFKPVQLPVVRPEVCPRMHS